MGLLSEVARNVLHPDPQEPMVTFASDEEVFVLQLNEEHNDIESGELSINSCDGSGDGGFVFRRVETFRHEEAMERHDWLKGSGYVQGKKTMFNCEIVAILICIPTGILPERFSGCPRAWVSYVTRPGA